MFQDYDPLVTPNPKHKSPLIISIDVVLKYLNDVNVPKGAAKANFVFRMRWKNHQLVWENGTFDSVKQIWSKSSNVWIPDVYHIDSGQNIAINQQNLVRIEKDGSCELAVVDMLWSPCFSIMKGYPSDYHNCSYNFVIANTDVTDSKVIAQFRGKEAIFKNGAWKVKANLKNSSKHGKPGFKIQLNITRKPLFMKRKIILPLCILSSVSAVSHLIPIDSGERISFSITALLTMMLSVQYMMDSLPESEDEPYVVLLARINLLLMQASLCLTAILMNVCRRKNRKMSHRTRTFFKGLGRVIFVNVASTNDVHEISSSDKESNEMEDDWMIAVRVLDRLFFVMFFVSMAFTMVELIKDQ